MCANAARKRIEDTRKFIFQRLFSCIRVQGEELSYRNQRVAAARHNISLKRMHCSSLRWKEYLQLEIFGFQSFLSVCFRSVSIVVKKGVRLGRTPGLAEQAFLSDKCRFVGQKHSLLPSGDGKIRGGEFRSEVCKVFRSVFASGPASDVSCYEGVQRNECVRHADLLCLVAETEECICTRWNSIMIKRYLARIISILVNKQSHSLKRTFFLES